MLLSLVFVAAQVYLMWRSKRPERMRSWELAAVVILAVGGWAFIFLLLAFYRPGVGWWP